MDVCCEQVAIDGRRDSGSEQKSFEKKTLNCFLCIDVIRKEVIYSDRCRCMYIGRTATECHPQYRATDSKEHRKMADMLSTAEDGDQCSEPPNTSGLATDPETSSLNDLKPNPAAASRNWNNWKWQMRNRIRSLSELAAYMPALARRTEIERVIQKYPMAITPYYASLIRQANESDPVFAQAVPQFCEMVNPPCLLDDPLEEHKDMPVPGLVHRYPDRALLIATTTCSMYCRHCTRKRVAGTRESTISPLRLQQVVTYLKAHPEIADVIISGGDPFTMSTRAIEAVLASIRSVPSVQIIRIGTRTPVVLPMRITDELVAMLKKFHPLWINTHFNHPNELTPEAAEACARLADAGIPLGNQSVLLRGVNDDPRVYEQLCRGLVRLRVRPYYLFQCDLVRGVEHFRTPLSRGIEIMEYLRGRVSGLAIPQFVVDAPHGGGKIPLLPNYIISSSPTNTVLRNYEGLIVNYPEPGLRAATENPEPGAGSNPGVWELAAGRASAIVPSEAVRYQRRKSGSAKARNRTAPSTGFLFGDDTEAFTWKETL
jgi:lysine 2,3-aminomutase